MLETGIKFSSDGQVIIWNRGIAFGGTVCPENCEKTGCPIKRNGVVAGRDTITRDNLIQVTECSRRVKIKIN